MKAVLVPPSQIPLEGAMVPVGTPELLFSSEFCGPVSEEISVSPFEQAELAITSPGWLRQIVVSYLGG